VRWLWRDGRVKEDALAHLEKAKNPDTDPRHQRRALTTDEQRRLIRAAAAGRCSFDLTGRDRAMLYRLALGTGFRRGELASLTPESFRLDDDPPVVTVKAAYSKRRREDRQPIRPELADALRPWVASKARGRPVFGRLTEETAPMLRLDLKAAGIPYETDEGFADFHCLRHTYITELIRAGVPIKTVQQLARHANPALTLKVYAHVGLYDLAGALDALPDLTAPPRPGAPALAATGTEGGRISEGVAQNLPSARDHSGPVVNDPELSSPAESRTPSSSTGGTQPPQVTALDPSGPEQTSPDAKPRGRAGPAPPPDPDSVRLTARRAWL
jgi:site-specific recombinase XerD